MAIEKLDQSELYGFPITDLETATAEETAAGISLPVIVTSGGALTYKVVTTKTWSDYVATTTADAIGAANAKVDAATAKVDAAVQSANRAAGNAQAAADNANSKAASLDSAVAKADKLSGDVSTMETRVNPNRSLENFAFFLSMNRIEKAYCVSIQMLLRWYNLL